MQCLHNRTDSRSHDPSYKPCIKRLKRDEVQDATHAEENPESGTSESRVFPLQRVVFIDSTWNQTNKISTDERLQGNHEQFHLCSFLKSSDCLWLLEANLLPQHCCLAWSYCVLGFFLTDVCFPSDLLQVELKMRKTCFWRHQKGKPDTYLATIEAIYYFLKDFHEHCLAQEYNGEYDNLLFFYSYLHSVVNKAKTSAGKCWGMLWGKTEIGYERQLWTVAEKLIQTLLCPILFYCLRLYSKNKNVYNCLMWMRCVAT